MHDSFGSRTTADLAGRPLTFYRLSALQERGVGDVTTLPYSLRVLLENLLRHEDGSSVTREDIEAVAAWDPKAEPSVEIAFRPARVVLQDFTGVPAVVDLAAMREAFARMGGDPSRINPLQPADLVIDHSVQVDHYRGPEAFQRNVDKEFERNAERYQFLKWGQQAFEGFGIVPPGTGIVHQVNLEYLARVVFAGEKDGTAMAWPDSLVGTDSHTTMINGLGVLGWGVGGIEAEAAMLGQPIAMLVPQVVGVRLTGRLPEGATATDLVLTVTERLRQVGVVGRFVEFFGPGLDVLSLPDRATLANMAPEYGATMGFFPVDERTLEYLRFTGRDEEQVRLVEAYLRAQGMFRTPDAPEPRFTEVVEVDLGAIVPSIAGPKRPQDRIALREAKASWNGTREQVTGGRPVRAVEVERDGERFELRDGAVVIAAITSCTNTSNPGVMVAAGLVARKAAERGLRAHPWVKTSLAPGSQVVTEYLKASGLLEDLQKVGFYLVGYGCTTCIGNSGPLDAPIREAIEREKLAVCAVLSGNRNFEGRVSPHTRGNYLASPPLVVAYALAGTLDIDFEREPLGTDREGNPVYLRDLWPSGEEVASVVQTAISPEQYKERYARVTEGPEAWRAIEAPTSALFAWDERSTYVRRPPFFDDVEPGEPPAVADIEGARVLALLGDTVTTDHISPAGAIPPDSPAGRYLQAHGVAPADFNSYGSRRGNHEVMMRGTFANIRLRNLLVPGVEGGYTRHLPDGEQMSIYDAAMRYAEEGVPLVVVAGKEYGTGSSRDWAAKGTRLLGVRAVLAESYERIHRSNLVGMGVLPLQFLEGQGREALGLTGEEVFSIRGLSEGLRPRMKVEVQAGDKRFEALVRLDTPQEVEYYRHGGILNYVLRAMAR